MDEKCPSCGRPGLIVESSPDGKTKKKKCLHCGHQQVEDLQGRKQLLEVPEQPSRGLLLG